MVKADDYETREDVASEMKRLNEIQRVTLDHNAFMYVDYIIYQNIRDLKWIYDKWDFVMLQRKYGPKRK